MDFDEQYGSDYLENLLKIYSELTQNGYSLGYLEAEDFEFLIDYFLKQNDINKALEVCDFAHEYSKNNTEFLEIKAEILLDIKRYNQAFEVLDLIQIQNGNILPINALLLKATLYLEVEKTPEAINLINKSVDYYPLEEQVVILHDLADIYDELLDFKQVFGTLVRIISINPLNDAALHKIAYWAELADMNQECQSLHELLLKEFPMHSILWYNLGSVLHNQKEYVKATEAYKNAIVLDEKLESAYRNLADIYMKQKEYDEAIDTLKEYLELGKPEDVVYEALGECYTKKKKYSEARSYYLAAANLNPHDDTLYYKVGLTYTKENKHKKALISYKSAYNLNPENYNYPLSIGNTYWEVENYLEGIKYFQQAVKLKPSAKATWIALFKALYEIEQFEKASEYLLKAFEECGDKAEFYMLEVALNIQTGRIKEALLSLEFAFENKLAKIKFLEELQPDILKRKQFLDLYNQYIKK